MNRQLQFLKTQSLGFDKEQVLVIETGLPPEKGMVLVERFREEALPYTDISHVSGSFYSFGMGQWSTIGFDANDGTYQSFTVNMVDYDYLDVHGIALQQGRGFSPEIASDQSQAIVVNEAFVRNFGWEDPLSAQLNGRFDTHQIIGVVEDFNFESLHAPVRPLALVLSRQPLQSGIGDESIIQSNQPKIAVRVR